ncbi:hypothetical protein GCAAIG_03070 [Candidatus Electronema halotolerans]
MKVENIFRAAVVIHCVLLLLLPSLAAGGQMQAGSREQFSAREREWFETFQKGTFYARGWKDITAELLAKAPAAAKDDLRKRLEDLGFKIGREWSKNNDIRKIDNEMLKQWGSQLQQTADREPARIVQVVASLNRKVTTLLD